MTSTARISLQDHNKGANSMLQEEFKELTGLAKAPVYWDRRYTKNLDKLSKPVYTVALETDVEIVMRDGVKLYCDVYHPAEIEKAPALIA